MTGGFEKIFRELCELDGASGGEGRVREYILDKIKDSCDSITVNPLGCIIAEKKGRKPADSRVMISAHMDEVGFIITDIRSDGTLSFTAVGGIDADVCAGRQVTVNGLDGVIGTVAVHNLSEEKRKKPVSFDDLYIDIGADSREEAEENVSRGDYAHFVCGYEVSEEGFVTAKAIDDRAGCAIMIDMITNDVLEHDCVFTFVTQEEVGLRGSRTAAFTVDPDFAIVLEATTAADIPLSEGDKKCCFCGKGAVISYMDRSTIYDRELYDTANRLAAENDILCQTKLVVAGGNDSGAIHITRGGIRTAAISVPCRYLHSPSCTAKLSDIDAVYGLAVKLAGHCAEQK
ncbi:MAG: M42 family peptidase [Oscillospiraceae bacterium]|nr:M42 family peptidase [Oscillospiraceae bacterium]